MASCSDMRDADGRKSGTKLGECFFGASMFRYDSGPPALEILDNGGQSSSIGARVVIKAKFETAAAHRKGRRPSFCVRRLVEFGTATNRAAPTAIVGLIERQCLASPCGDGLILHGSNVRFSRSAFHARSAAAAPRDHKAARTCSCRLQHTQGSYERTGRVLSRNSAFEQLN